MPSQRPQTPHEADIAVAVFVQYRPRLLGIAHRVLGNAVEAEDVLQEVWLRWQKTDQAAVVSPAAFLATVTTRLALNVAQSARMRRETATGPWLAEPVDVGPDPESRVEQHEDLALALLLLLKRLTPVERAAFLLREAFDYSYPEIARMLRLSQGNARKVVSRARGHLAEERRVRGSTVGHRRLLAAFVAAARAGDVASLEALLTADTGAPPAVDGALRGDAAVAGRALVGT
ncbi:sigma-70 family RNA polymerase sigma factor [Streptomyces sp. PB17]|uniref:sigma-70 family RNA polymerase sigma factor n=1 Tax=Streptomyces sp. PB17 TaxID=3384158 RepID=UPI0038B52242